MVQCLIHTIVWYRPSIPLLLPLCTIGSVYPLPPGMRVIVRISSDQRPVEFLAYSKTKGKGIYGELSKNKLPAGYYRNSRQHSIMQSDEIFVAVRYIILARFKLSELGVEAVDTTPL